MVIKNARNLILNGRYFSTGYGVKCFNNYLSHYTELGGVHGHQ
jgi:hypothetical protein